MLGITQQSMDGWMQRFKRVLGQIARDVRISQAFGPTIKGESPLDPGAWGHYQSALMGFETLGLSAAVLEAIKESGYNTPTPIQAQAIPIILEGRDVIGASQTGTGKTAAFALPSLSKVTRMGKPQILVLEPTRELAHQVAESFQKYGKHTGLKVALLYGGVGLGKQTEELEAGADIVVATPGRLIDHFYRTSMRFGEVKILILDEVDRMLDMGFLPQVRKIVNLCPWEGRQTLFFSATMPAAIQTFAQWCLVDPMSVEIARRAVASTVTHAFYPVAMDQRDELLLALLKETDYHSVMIFTRTRKEADDVTSMIKSTGQPKVAAMHSDINQVDRMKALAGFKSGDFEILVATDVAARGIDISGVSHVINYRVPENAEDYVHRIGRTGRAEAEGDAFTILTADELDYAKSVEVFIDQKIQRKKLEGFGYTYTALLDDSPPKPVRRKSVGGKKRR
jgi:ATP-dependent RNA helicase RhlE